MDGEGLDLSDPTWPILTEPPELVPAFIGDGAVVRNATGGARKLGF